MRFEDLSNCKVVTSSLEIAFSAGQGSADCEDAVVRSVKELPLVSRALLVIESTASIMILSDCFVKEVERDTCFNKNMSSKVKN